MEPSKIAFGGIVNLNLQNGIQVMDNLVLTPQMAYNQICHYHTFYELTMVYEGSVLFEINTQRHLHVPGTIHLMRPQDNHTMYFTTPIRYFIIQFKESFVDTVLSRLLYERPDPMILDLNQENSRKFIHELSILAALYTSLGNSGQQDQHLFEIKLRLQLLLLQMLRISQNEGAQHDTHNDDMILFRIMDYTRQHYRENVSLANVADYAGISKNYLCSYFHDRMKITYWTYLSHFRLNTAMSMILSTNESISQISYLSGFNSYTTFNKAFRKRYGFSPTDCRKKRYG